MARLAAAFAAALVLLHGASAAESSPAVGNDADVASADVTVYDERWLTYDPSDPETDWNTICAQNRCQACLRQAHCGWCPYTFTCMYGDATGPKHFGQGKWSPLACEAPKGIAPWTFSGNSSAVQPMCSYAKGTQVQAPESPPIDHMYDILCKNGGQRYWDRSSLNAGDSYCACPDGWGGVMCETCLNDDVCYAGEGVNASCARAVLPYEEQEMTHKRFSCSCAGDAAQVCNFYAPQLPGAVRIQIDYNATGSSVEVILWTPVPNKIPAFLFGGIDFWSNASECELTRQVPGGCPTGEAYDWHGDAPCLQIDCRHVNRMYGPGPDGRDCLDHDHWGASWRYHACPPFLDEVQHVSWICQYQAVSNGSYACAFVTDGFGPIAMQCQTGTCIHSDIPPPPPPTPPPGPLITDKEWFAIILGGPSVLGLIFAASCGAVLCSRGRELDRLSEKDAARRRTVSDLGGLLSSASGSASTMAGKGKRGRASSKEASLLAADGGPRGAAGGAGSEGDADDANPSGVAVTLGHEDSEAALLDFEFEAPTTPTLGSVHANGREPPVFSFSDVTYTVTSGSPHRPVLRGVNGVARPAVLAILGPSGAGKTTLLDILAGRKSTAGGQWGGSVRLNGAELSPQQLRLTTGYILQDDVMMGTQTVREYLLFQARLRVAPSVPLAERYRRVDKVLGQLGLRHVADTKIGGEFVRGISGGEKRRVSIAAELITDSSVLLVDEPTSGLDSASAKAVVDALVRVAKSGRVVIMSIHQPRSYIWNQFDSVLLLAKGGQTLFCGPRAEALSHFGRLGHACPADYNPADFLLDMVASVSSREIERLARACPTDMGELARNAPPPRKGSVEEEEAAGGAGSKGGHGGTYLGGDDGPNPEDHKAGEAGSGGGSGSGSISPMPMDAGHREGRASTLDRTVPGARGEFDMRAVSTGAAGRRARPPTEARDVVRPFYRQHAGFWRQLWELSIRTSMNIIRNPMLVLLNYTATASVAIGVSVVFKDLPFDFYGLQDRLGFFFFSFLFFGMTSLSSLGVWREERLLFLRERAMGCYGSTAYFLAKVMCDLLPLRVLPPIIYTAIVYWAIGLQDKPLELARFAMVMVMVNVLSASLCLAVGALVPNLSLANLVASFLQLFTMLLCGLLSHNVEDFPSLMYIMQKLSFLNYAFEILANNEFVGQTYNLSPKLPGGKTPPMFPATGETIISTFGLSLDHMNIDCGMLFVFLGMLLAAVYLILRFAVREKR